MRSVALDLGKRISFCEVSDGRVIGRATVRRLSELERWLGPGTPKARVAIEACREAWFVERTLREWGHEPLVVDTTRVKRLGIGQHKRKTDRIDAEVLARAVESGGIPLAHVLTPHRQQLRLQLSVRRALIETRAQYVTTIRGLVAAGGQRLPTCNTHTFAAKVREYPLDEKTKALVTPLVALLEALEPQIRAVDEKLDSLSSQEPVVALLKTAPGVADVVAAAFVSVVDDAKRFRDAHEVEAYLGLVPSEYTSGKRRLGAITKQGNRYLRALLIQSAWALLRQSSSDDPLKRWGQAIAARRGKRVAVVAIARRLVGVLWAMWRDGTVYEAERVGIASAAGIQLEAQSLQIRAAALLRAARKGHRRRPPMNATEGHMT
jgi:transposase